MGKSILLVAGMLVLLLVTACSQDKIEEFRITQMQKEQGYIPDPLAFDAVITFCRYQSSRSGEFIDAGEHFGIFEGSRVRAYVELKNLEPDRVHSVHLSWLRPGDDFELFRKYAEIRVEEVDEGWRKVIHWKEAVDLVGYEEEVQEGPDPHVLLDATMTADPDRGRDLGVYTLRVYYNRELLTEGTFTLIDSETALSGARLEDGAFVMEPDTWLDAQVKLVGLDPGREHEAELSWRDPDGDEIFDVDFEIAAAGDGTARMDSQMEISRDRRRKPGRYELRIHLDGTQVGERKFELKKM